MTSYLSISKEAIEGVNPYEGADLFYRIIHAELGKLQFSKHLLKGTFKITQADDGIDAEIPAINPTVHTFLPAGRSFYQIKTGDFNLDLKSNRKKILFTKDKKNLKPRVKECLDSGGTLGIVTFKWDIAKSEQKLHNKFQDEIIEFDSRYKNVKLQFLTTVKLAGIIDDFWGLKLELLGLAESSMFSHAQWIKLPEYAQDLKSSEKIENKINNIASAIKEQKFTRILGEAGVGKTRHVMESCRDNGLRELVLYYESYTSFVNDVVARRMRHNSGNAAAVIVIDECDRNSHQDLWNHYKTLTPDTIRFVTIYNDPNEFRTEDTVYELIEQASPEVISSIIQIYITNSNLVNRWVEGCGGSPRVAHIIGRSLRENPDDPLKPGNFDDLWIRVITGYDNPSKSEIQDRLGVLASIALFKRVGFEGDYRDEFKYFHKSILKENVANLAITDADRIIEHFRKMKILQGENTLYLSPNVLHIWLWRYWWNNYGNKVNIDDILAEMPQQLLEWFFEMFIYAKDAPKTRDIAITLFRDDKSLQDSPLFNTDLGQKIYSNLSRAFPDIGLDYAKNKLDGVSISDLKQFKRGRREVIWALENSVRWRKYFHESAKLLCQLALAENESYGNNATGIFINLFSHGYAHKATTETPPVERFPILESLIESDDDAKIALGLSCIEKGLQSKNILAFSQGVNPFAPQPEYWIPSDHLEVRESYHRIWHLLIQVIGHLSGDLLSGAIKIAIDNSTEVAFIEGLQGQVLADIRQIMIAHPTHKKAALRRLSQAIHYGPSWGLQDLEEWQSLYNDLLGDNYHDRLMRYVGMRLIEDEFDGHKRDNDHIKSEIERLIDEAINDPHTLQNELNWLVTTKAERAYEFGYKLGQMDTKRLFLQPLLEALRSSENDTSATIVGVYLCAMNEANNNLWWQCTNNIYNDEVLRVHYLDIIFYSGLNDKTASQVLSLVKQDVIGFERLRLFIGGRATEPLSPSALNEWLVYLMECDDFWAVGTAIELAAMYSFHKDPKMDLPVDTLFRMVTHQALFFKKDRANSGTMVAFEWHQIAVRLFKREDRVRDDLLSKILSFLEDQNAVLNDFEFYTYECLNEFATVDPNLTWEKIHPYLADPASSAYYILQQWLNGSYIHRKAEPGIKYFDPSDILSWCEEDSENRAKILADIVPPDYDSDFPWLRTILENMEAMKR
ncbi:MAG: hypothetical protein IIA60_00950 [Candidatus Marinimicrobia bacterium]|nr:hypothetical protein [Candidatus Neomarinimicrobiota bacterium]